MKFDVVEKSEENRRADCKPLSTLALRLAAWRKGASRPRSKSTTYRNSIHKRIQKRSKHVVETRNKPQPQPASPTLPPQHVIARAQNFKAVFLVPELLRITMSDSTTPSPQNMNTTRDMVVWADPLHTIYTSFMRSPNAADKVSYASLMEAGPAEKGKLKRAIFRILNELARSPIDEVELLMILLALHKTSDVVKILWCRTDKGQRIKETYVEAKTTFLRHGIIDES